MVNMLVCRNKLLVQPGELEGSSAQYNGPARDIPGPAYVLRR